MSRCRRILFSFLILGLLLLNVPQGVHAQSGIFQKQYDRTIVSFSAGRQDEQLGVLAATSPTQSTSEIEPDGPHALVYEQGVFLILDTLNQRVLRYDAQSHQQGQLALPEGYYANLRVQDGNLYLYNPAEEKINLMRGESTTLQTLSSPEAIWEELSSTESDLEAGQAPDNLAAYFDQGALTGSLYAETERIDNNHARFNVFDNQAVLLATLVVETGHSLGSARFLGQDNNGNFYVQVEEVLEDVPAIIAETTIRRYSADAQYLDSAYLPLEKAYFLPDRPVALDPQGGAYFLLVKETETQILQLGFNPQTPSLLEQRWEALAATNEFHVASLSKTDVSITGALSITRQQVIQAAQAYMNVNWTLSPANYYKGQAGNWNNCSTDTVKRENWRLPRYLTGRVNQVIKEVPYAWGGYQSIATFNTKLSQGNWAGNICSQEVRSNVAGVDCSGFVSQVLSLGGYYTTYRLPNVAHRINWNDLRPGDFLLNQGHVMLFDRFENGRTADGGVWVYESTVKNNWDRVVYDQVSYSYLTQYGYAAWRANNIVEDSPPVHQNVIRNGDFTAGLNQWNFYGEINYVNRDGALYANRYADGTGASVYQDINYPLELNYPMEISLSLGNYSAVDKVFYLNLRSTDTWSGSIGCGFTVPAGADMKTYRAVGKVPARWANARFEYTISSFDSQPNLIVDNISVKYRPDLAPNGVECTVSDPPPAYTMILDHNVTGSGWVKVDTQNTVSCSKNQGNLYYNRTARGGDTGAAHWWINVPVDGYYEVFAYMPSYSHTMAVTPHARYWVEYEGMPSGGPSQLVVLDQNQNLCQWVSLGTYRYIPGKSYGVYLGNANIPTSVTVPNLIAADQVMVVPVGNPDRTGPGGSLITPIHGSTLYRAAPSTTINLQANASDASSGVAKVEFHVLYDNEWHSIGTDYNAPYAMTWTVPGDIAPQVLTFTIHVIDRTGNETLDPGGYRTVSYQMANKAFGYDVTKNGYSFSNFGDLNLNDFTYLDFANMVGKDRVCYWIGGLCIPTPEGSFVYDLVFLTLSGGRCAGMSVTNQIFFKGLDSPGRFQSGAVTTSDLHIDTTSVRRFISWYQIRQMYAPADRYLADGAFGAPVVELYKLYDAFNTSNGDWPILAIRGSSGGHALTPYAIEAKDSGVYWIRVYDSNAPGNTQRYIVVNTLANTWTYSPLSWSGDASSRNFGVIPMSLFFAPTTTALADSNQSPLMRTLATGETGVTLWVSGTDQVIVTDSSGRQIGYDNGQFYNDIPEALWYTPLDSLGGFVSSSMALPTDMEYEVRVSNETITSSGLVPTASVENESITIARFGPGYSLRVDATVSMDNTSDVFTIAADGSAVRFDPGSGSSSADLALGSNAAGESYQVSVEGLSSMPGEPVQLIGNNGLYKLDYSQAQAGTYTLQIEHINGDQVDNFLHEQISIESGAVHYLNISDWNPGEVLVVDVDANADGEVDETVNLVNTYYRVYIPVSLK